MKAALVLLVALTGTAAAQVPPTAAPHQADIASCLAMDTAPGAPVIPLPPGGVATPIPWTEFVVEGSFVQGDTAASLHALLEPTLAQYRTTLTAVTLREHVSKVTAKLGYQLADAHSKDIAGGAQLVLVVQPLPIVRRVAIEVDTKWYHLFDKLLDEEIKNRMQVRVGSYLPADPIRRQCMLIEERQRILDYLYDEGYFDATIPPITAPPDSDGTTVIVQVKLGAEYHVCDTVIPLQASGEPLAVPIAEIRSLFQHKGFHFLVFALGTTRFTRAQYQDDLQQVRELFHKKLYPAARIQSSLNDPETLRSSFDRHTKCVNATLIIDQRRKIDLRFDGNDRNGAPDEWLREQLTFNKAGATDDVEAANSARAIAEALQKRGMFDAHVTWTRDRRPDFDVIAFHIYQGKGREVADVEFEGNDKNKDREFNDDILAGLVATKKNTAKGDLLGTNTNATSPNMATDIDRIREYYRRAGYRDAHVGVTASPGCPQGTGNCAVGDVAFATSLVESNQGDDLYVKFHIDPGPRTLLAGVELEPGDSSAGKDLAGALCDQLVGELATELSPTRPGALGRRVPGKCAALVGWPDFPFREDDVGGTRDRLRDFLIKLGRPRAELVYEARIVGPNLVQAHYTLRDAAPRKIGKIVIRGNFKTTTDIISGELRLREGEPLTSDALADAARRLRATGLFDAVNIDPLDLGGGDELVNAIVRVEERYDNRAQVDLEVGYSSYNGAFGTATTKLGNIYGVGANFSATGTYGQKIKDLEGTFKLPQYLVRHWTGVEVQTELSGLYLQQDTPRFGLLTTEGATLAFTHITPYPKTRTRARAKQLSYGGKYDYRVRTRNVDALRPIGSDMDDSQVAIATETGSVGGTLDFDGRVDRAGQLSPLAAADGFRVAATASWAFPQIAPLVGGQNSFIKASLTASKFYSVGDNLVLRGDFRYDEGFPLGGQVLLPDVERFFSGGDNTVRGYQDDRMATEIIRVAVPPLGGIEQIRVIPAGGNIRMLSSVDAQYRIYSIMAGAVFTDAGMIQNRWAAITKNDIRPSTGIGLRFLSPFGVGAIEYAVPLYPHLGDDPRGRLHIYFAARAQF